MRAGIVLARREAQMSARLLLLLAVLLVALAYLATSAYPAFRERMLANSRKLPPFLRHMLDARAGKVTFEAAAVLLYVHPVALVAMALWPIQRASRAIAGEIERGGLGWKLAYPIGRTAYVLGHAAVLWLGVVVLQLALFGGLRFALWHFGIANAGPLPYLWCALGGGLLYAAVGMLTLAVSAVSSRTAAPATAGAAFVIVGVILDNIGTAWPLVDRFSWLSPFHYFRYNAMLLGAPLAWKDALVLGGLAIAGLAAAVGLFRRRDLSI